MAELGHEVRRDGEVAPEDEATCQGRCAPQYLLVGAWPGRQSAGSLAGLFRIRGYVRTAYHRRAGIIHKQHAEKPG